MNNNLSPVIDILYEAEETRVEGCRRACELLSPAVTPTIEDILTKKEQRLAPFPNRFDALLADIAGMLGKCKAERNITDWPFEYFWGNPNEPYHSAMLGYFIDPKAEHGCGRFLLQKFFEVLKKLSCVPSDYQFSTNHYEVRLEWRKIDLLITCDCEGEKYAIIIENKVNDAVNQDEQLQRYVKSVNEELGFDYNQIYVFYLPLTKDKDPDAEDLDAILCRKNMHGQGLHYKKITFDVHILGWLKASLESEWQPGVCEAVRKGMSDNITHYINLIKYLINNHRQLTMDTEILRQLEQAEKANKLPTLLQVQKLQESADALKSCLQSVLRGKLLIQVQSLLRQKGVEADFYTCEPVNPEKCTFDFPFDPRFENEQVLGVKANEAVMICLGASNKEEDWVFSGYKRAGTVDEQKKYGAIVISEAASRWVDKFLDNDPALFVYAWNGEINYTNCLDAAVVDRLVNDLLKMRQDILLRIESVSEGSRG